MSAFIIGIGVALAAIGIVLTTNGLVIYQSTFGNAMATVGGIALVGGFVIIALGFIYRLLLQISEKLDGVVVPYEVEDEAQASADAEPTNLPPFIHSSHAPSPLAAPPRREPAHHEPPRAANHEAPRPAPAAPAPVAAPTPAPAPYVPPPRPRPAPVSLEPDISEPIGPEPAPPAPAPEPPREHGLPSWFRRNREPVPPPPPVATRNFQLDDGDEPAEPRPGRGGYRDEPREDDFPSVVKSGPFNFDLPERESDDLDFEPIVPRRGQDEPAPAREPTLREPAAPREPAVPREPTVHREPIAHREPTVREPVARPAAGGEEVGPGLPPAFLRPGSSSAAPAPAPAPAPTPAPEPRQPTVLKSGFIGGMAYTLYSDGSIEAELPDGTLRFGSLQELREHVAATSSQGGG
jgi:hypothetical protein